MCNTLIRVDNNDTTLILYKYIKLPNIIPCYLCTHAKYNIKITENK